MLAIDLDMESPGLGSLLLDEDTLPLYGMVDALVENGLSGLDEQFYLNLIGPSPLAHRSGRIDVLPSFGQRSVSNPGDVLAKIARVYAEDLSANGEPLTLMDQISEVIRHFSDVRRYDAILIDARAGLHEIAAAAILGLGAEVFLFGLDEPQTFQGYAALLSHLARFKGSEVDQVPEWVERISMVQGKAPLEARQRMSFDEACKSLFFDSGLVNQPHAERESGPQPAALPFRDVPWDDELPDDAVLPREIPSLESIAVLEDDAFRNFNPCSRRDLMAERVYRSTFGALLDRMDTAMEPEIRI